MGSVFNPDFEEEDISLTTLWLFILMVHITVAAYYYLTLPLPIVPVPTFTSPPPIGERNQTVWQEYGWPDSSSWFAFAKYGFENGIWQYLIYQFTGLNLPIPTMDSGLKYVADICATWARDYLGGFTGVADASPPTKAMYPFRVIKATHS